MSTISVCRPSTAITSLWKAKRTAQAGQGDRFHQIIFGGIAFQGFVRADGGLLFAASQGDLTTPAPGRNPPPLNQVAGGVAYQSDQILNSAIAAAIPDIGRVRIETNDRTTLVFDSTNAIVLQRVGLYRNLTWNTNDHQLFQVVANPFNIQLAVGCQPRRFNLDRVLYHGCGHLARPHWFGRYSSPSSTLGPSPPTMAMNLVVYHDDPI